MGRWDKREQELLEEQQAQEEKTKEQSVKQDGIDLDGNGVIDAGEGQNIRNDTVEENRRGYHK